MAKRNFQGDLSGLNNKQLDYIESVISNQGIKVDKVTFAPVGIAGDNYVANVKRFTVEGEKTLSFVVKIAPENEITRTNFNTAAMFQNEHIMYTEILPKMLELQRSADVPEDELLRFPKCYGSFTEEPNEVIILEDLKTSGYAMKDRFEPLTDEYVRPILKTFAFYHSLSYVMKNKEAEVYDGYKNKLIDTWKVMTDNPEMQMYFGFIINDAVTVLSSKKHIDTVRSKITNIPLSMLKLVKQDDNCKYSIIQQGDAWTNNLMFRNSDNNNIDLIMIDYQQSKHNNPAFDILYMIFNCTDFSGRSKHFNDWIDYYHSQLDKSLSYFGMKANYVYPRDKLDTDLKRYGKVMLGLSFMICNVLIRKPDDAAKMKETMDSTDKEMSEEMMAKMVEAMSISNLDQQSVGRYRNKIVGLVESCIQLGLI